MNQPLKTLTEAVNNICKTLVGAIDETAKPFVVFANSPLSLNENYMKKYMNKEELEEYAKTHSRNTYHVFINKEVEIKVKAEVIE